MIRFPNCKINLGLNVLAKRPDGYHDIETLFWPVPWCDALEILPAAGKDVSFRSTGLAIPGDPEENLCVKAFRLMQERHGIPGASIHLHKAVPMGSGLGGGSSDASFTLMILDELFGLSLGTGELLRLAALLGSDCPFFILNEPCLATGRGEVLTPFSADLSGMWLLVAVPDVHVGTAGAYRSVTPRIPEVSLTEALKHPVPQWKTLLVNDFEKPVSGMHPEIGALTQEMYQYGAVYAAMSGSGSAVFGIFPGRPELVNLRNCEVVSWVGEVYFGARR